MREKRKVLREEEKREKDHEEMRDFSLTSFI